MLDNLSYELAELLCDNLRDSDMIQICNDNNLLDDFIYCTEEDFDYITRRNHNVVADKNFSFSEPYFYINDNIAYSFSWLDFEDYAKVSAYMLSHNECFDIPEAIKFFEEHNLSYKKHNLFLIEFTDTHETGIADTWDIEIINHNSRKWGYGNILKIIREATEEDLVKHGYNR